jgi:hypothetical protein
MRILVKEQRKLMHAQTKEVKNEARRATYLADTQKGYSAGEGIGMFLCLTFMFALVVGYVWGFVYIFTHLPHLGTG